MWFTETGFNDNTHEYVNSTPSPEFEPIQKGAAEVMAVSYMSRKSVNLAASEILDFATQSNDSLRDSEYFMSHLEQKLAGYEQQWRTQRHQEWQATGYASMTDIRASDPKTGLSLTGDTQIATFYASRFQPRFLVEAHDGESSLEAVARWARKFISPDKVNGVFERIAQDIDDLNRSKAEEKGTGRGSSFLYYYSQPYISLDMQGDKTMLFIGIDAMKQYDGQPHLIRQEGLTVDATPDVLVELQGVIERKKAQIVSFDADPETMTVDELRHAAIAARQSTQQRKFDNLRYTTPEFDAISPQDLINAGIFIPDDGEPAEVIPRAEKDRIRTIVKKVEELNAAYVTVETGDIAHADYRKATYNYEHIRESKWGKALITQYGINSEGRAVAKRKKPNAPQGWEPVVSRYEFGEKYQQHAAELIIQLANKNLRRENIKEAQELIGHTEHTEKVIA